MSVSERDRELSRLLRRLKERSKRSYEDLAGSTFVSSSTLHRYCSGKSVPPDVGVVVRIAKECGASGAELQEVLRAWSAADARRQQPSNAVSPRTPAPASPPPSSGASTGAPSSAQGLPALSGSPGASPALEDPHGAAPAPHDGTTAPALPTPHESTVAPHGTTPALPAATPAPHDGIAAVQGGLPVPYGVTASPQGEAGTAPVRAGRRGTVATRAGLTTADPPRTHPARRARRTQMSGVLLTLLLLVMVLSSAGSPSPAEPDTMPIPQWVSGPSWVRAPYPVSPKIFGVTMNSNTGNMPTFRVGAVRFWDSGTRWAGIQPRRGEFDWSTLDRLVDGANRAGLPALFVFGAAPSWAAPQAPTGPYQDRSRAAAPDDLDDWDTLVKALVSRYRGRIEAYELWVMGNDPRFFTSGVETLVEMTRRAGEIVRREDPEAIVVCPGMGRLWDAEARRTLERFAELGGYRHCDVAGIKLHQHRPSDPPETMLEILRYVNRTMHRAGVHLPLWNTGTTYEIPLQGSLDDRRAVDNAVRFYLLSLYATDLGLQRMYFYNWGGTNIPIVLQAEGGAPTRAALAVEELQRWLARTRLRSCGRGLPIGLPDNVWQCEFLVAEAEGEHRAVIRWTHSGTAETVVGPSATRVRHLDGTVTEVRPEDGLRVTERPVLVEYR
ncbi:hypothetical protein GCM10010517_76790 [Streptosporangium fragile]|uniref:HTH cro/C1-type domain-containing protein n=1 Tax=Streptosporangium fragile TaxID=46186 RepID=A0ABN3WDN3_9ACTN